MAHPSEMAAMAVIAVVAIVALILAVIAFRAKVRTGNKALIFLTLAFALLAIKSILVATSLPTHLIGHEHLELVAALFDLGIVVLIAIPLLK
jgi:steroid 5-alpha reductase family enzyme